MVACGWQVLELFKAADKYDVPGLVKECVQIFRKITRSADVAPLLQVTCYSRLLLLFPLQDDSKWVHAQLCSCVSGIDFGTLHQQSCSDCSLWQPSKQVLLVCVKIALMYSVWLAVQFDEAMSSFDTILLVGTCCSCFLPIEHRVCMIGCSCQVGRITVYLSAWYNV